MSLIVETGTASSLSEAYASVAYCDTYHDNMGNALWATLQTVEKEQAIRRASNHMSQTYRLQWKGVRTKATQALDWPRYNVQIPDLGVFNIVMPDTIPDLLLRANAEYALLAAAGNLNPPNKQNIISQQVGPLKVVYDSMSPQNVRYDAINNLVRPLLDFGAGASHKLRRV